MKCLERNKTSFEYLPYDGTETDLNDDGEHTGDFRPEMGKPKEYRGNISVPSGQTQQLLYGEDIRYTHTLIMDNPNADINEYGVIRWKGEMYDITAVRPSLNFLSIALKKQTVNFAKPYEPDDEPDETEGNEEP